MKEFGFIDHPIPEHVKKSVGKIGLFELPRDKDDKPPENYEKIPPPIRYIHPKLSYNNYSKYKKDPLFLYKSVGICEECFLTYISFLKKYLINLNLFKLNIVMVQCQN